MNDITLSKHRTYILFPGLPDEGVHPLLLRVQDVICMYGEDTESGYFIRFILQTDRTISINYAQNKELRDMHLESLLDHFIHR